MDQIKADPDGTVPLYTHGDNPKPERPYLGRPISSPDHVFRNITVPEVVEPYYERTSKRCPQQGIAA